MPRTQTQSSEGQSAGLGPLLADLGKRYGLQVGALSTVVKPVRGLSTDNLAVDYATGVGGLPLGRITELYGPPSSGKTTTALQCAAALQRRIIAGKLDEHILYLDFEHAIDPDYCAALGLDTEHRSFLLARPPYLETGADAALELIATGKIRLLVVDSVASMAPKALDGSTVDRRTTAMDRARLLSAWLLRLVGQLNEHECAAVFINHLMEAIDMSGARAGYLPPQETTPGGKGLKFYASLRLRYQQTKQIKLTAADALTNDEGIAVVGSQTTVKVTKNKVGPPFRQAEVRVTFGKGFDNAWSALQVLIAHKQISKSGAWYKINLNKQPHLHHPAMKPQLENGVWMAQGEQRLLDFIEAHPDWRAALITAATRLAATAGGYGLETGDLAAPDEPGDIGEGTPE